MRIELEAFLADGNYLKQNVKHARSMSSRLITTIWKDNCSQEKYSWLETQTKDQAPANYGHLAE